MNTDIDGVEGVHPNVVRGVDKVLAVQRPLVLAHIRSIRLRHPDDSPAELIHRLEKRYITAVTAGGAGVGAAAVVPGIGTGASLALAGVETFGFIESTALFAQSVAEVHGIAVNDPDRARALVLALMLGGPGVDLVRQLSKTATGGKLTLNKHWGDLITTSLPTSSVASLVDKLKPMFLRQLATRGGASVLGKAAPFGIGAAIGGLGNNLMARGILNNSRKAFGPAPIAVSADLEPRPDAQPLEHKIARGSRLVANAAVAAGSSVGSGVRSLTGKVIKRTPKVKALPAHELPEPPRVQVALGGH